MKSKFLGVTLATLFISLANGVSAQDYDKGHIQFGARYGGTLYIPFAGEQFEEVTAAWRFNRRHALGIGTGLLQVDHTDDGVPWNENGTVQAIPLFLDYTYYIPFHHHDNHSFTLGASIGGAWYVDELPLKNSSQRAFGLVRFSPGLDFKLFKRLHLDIGLNIQYEYDDIPGFGAQVGLKF